MTDLAAILEFLTDHPKVLLLLGGWYVFCNFASSLPKPEEVSAALPGNPIASLIYKTIFGLIQACAGNLARIIPILRLTAKQDDKS